jgi:glycosyltransferase involved in cell wall biosynthesis
MLGWEFPPYISGGLGTACYGLTKGLDELGVGICFVLPTPVPVDGSSHVAFRSPASLADRPAAAVSAADREISKLFEHVEVHRLQAYLQAYGQPVTQEEVIREVRRLQEQGQLSESASADLAAVTELQPTEAQAMPAGRMDGGMYHGDLMEQIQRYEKLAVALAKDETFDVVHAHDWMTFPAGMGVAAATGKPLVVHVHSTEFDRSGLNINQQIYDIERAGMTRADRVVCVSHLTRTICTSRYGVPAEKVAVVYNAVQLPADDAIQMRPISHKEKIVLFLGRVTMQKGPEYFLRAARKVVDKYDAVRFVMAGSGDMVTQCINEVADLRLGSHVTFTGFLHGQDVDRIFSMADLFVMPSVSEPFGIAPLEALTHNVPVIISRQSGVSEVLQHVLKVDFWDTDEMANKILAVLRHPPLQRTLRQHGQIEVRKLSWRDSAEKLKSVYAELTGKA